MAVARSVFEGAGGDASDACAAEVRGRCTRAAALLYAPYPKLERLEIWLLPRQALPRLCVLHLPARCSCAPSSRRDSGGAATRESVIMTNSGCSSI